MKLYNIGLILILSIIHSDVAGFDQHIYLSRHAEKNQDKQDPGLTDKGNARAQWIAEFLKNKSIEVIYSTDYKRTRDTAAPLAKLLNQTVVFYNPRSLSQLAGKLINEGKTSFVVGHSNTTPFLVKLLKGEPGRPMTEKDYDRLYHIVVSEGHVISTEEIISLPAPDHD